MSELSYFVGAVFVADPNAPHAMKKKVLIRKNFSLDANTPVDLINPGPDWIKQGDDFFFQNLEAFNNHAMIHRNGQLLFVQTNEVGGDVYPVVELDATVKKIVLVSKTPVGSIIQIHTQHGI